MRLQLHNTHQIAEYRHKTEQIGDVIDCHIHTCQNVKRAIQRRKTNNDSINSDGLNINCQNQYCPKYKFCNQDKSDKNNFFSFIYICHFAYYFALRANLIISKEIKTVKSRIVTLMTRIVSYTDLSYRLHIQKVILCLTIF